MDAFWGAVVGAVAGGVMLRIILAAWSRLRARLALVWARVHESVSPTYWLPQLKALSFREFEWNAHADGHSYRCSLLADVTLRGRGPFPSKVFPDTSSLNIWNPREPFQQVRLTAVHRSGGVTVKQKQLAPFLVRLESEDVDTSSWGDYPRFGGWRFRFGYEVEAALNARYWKGPGHTPVARLAPAKEGQLRPKSDREAQRGCGSKRQ